LNSPFGTLTCMSILILTSPLNRSDGRAARALHGSL
jgi:hypothetical protein